MNPYQVLFLLLYLFSQVLAYALKLVNLRHMKRHCGDLPQAFKEYIDGATLQKSCEYTLESTAFSLKESFFGNAVTLFFIFGGLLNVYNEWIASLEYSFVLEGVIFFLVLMGAGEMLSVPFNLYEVFRIENRYGFNTMTARLWVADFVKSITLSAVIGGTVLGCAFWIIQLSPRYWWLFLWGFFFFFSVFMMYISPYVIEPLFNKFTPLEGGALEHRIRDTMEKAGIRVGRVFKMDASKRSRHSNAYFSGVGRVKRIVLFDTLIRHMNNEEILAVLAHEAGHWKKRHVVKMIAIFEVFSFVGAYVAFVILKSDLLAEIFGIGHATFFAKAVLLAFLFSIISLCVTPLLSYLSRMHEEEADGFAAGLTGNPENLATALIKLSKENLSNLHPHPLYAKVYYSHPPIIERIEKIRKQAGS